MQTDAGKWDEPQPKADLGFVGGLVNYVKIVVYLWVYFIICLLFLKPVRAAAPVPHARCHPPRPSGFWQIDKFLTAPTFLPMLLPYMIALMITGPIVVIADMVRTAAACLPPCALRRRALSPRSWFPSLLPFSPTGRTAASRSSGMLSTRRRRA